MQWRVTLVLVLVALVAAWTWSWIQPSEPTIAPGTSASAAEEQSPAAAPEIAAPLWSVQGPAGRVELSEQSVTEVEAPSMPGATPFRIRVVDSGGQVRVGAEVSYWIFQLDEERELDPEGVAWSGPIHETNERGQVELDLSDMPSHALIYARQGGEWAQGVLTQASRNEVTTLTLTEDLRLEVRVLDALGRPRAGVPLSLATQDQVHRQGWGFSIAESQGVEGLAVFQHFQINYPEGFDGSAFIKLNRPSPRPVLEKVRLDPPPAEPVEFRVPDHGSIRCEFVDSTLQPITELPDWLGIKLSFRELDGTEHMWRQNVGESPAVLELVPLEMEYRIEVDSIWFNGESDWFAGPTGDGEEVTIRIQLETLPRLRGRLTNEQGQPLAGYWWVTGILPDGQFYRGYFETKQDGEFLAALPCEEPKARDELALVFTWSTRTEPVAAFEAAHHTWSEGVNDLGDVILREPQPLISGRAVDLQGEPIAQASVALAIARETDRTVPAVWVATTTTDDDGSFELRGPAAGLSNLRLRVGRYPGVPCFAGQHGETFTIDTRN